jgi:threonine aldolase
VDSRRSFVSDNHAGAHESVIRALAQANTGDATSYGDDAWTERASAALQTAFGARGGVFFVFTGTAANILGLSLLLRPYEAVICPESAHLHVDECGAIERVLGGKLLTVATPDGKLTPSLIAPSLVDRGDQHRIQARVVAISQATERGTCYTLDELKVLGEFCRGEGLLLYVDGARLANAAAHLGCDLADLAAQADVLSFGGTKNGAIGAEAVVVMDEDRVTAAPFLRKQQTQLASKMRYLSAQFLGLLEDDLWLHNARQANAMARRLADGIRDVPDVELRQAVEANMVFATMHPAHILRLQDLWRFYLWDPAAHLVRLMTAFDTTEADVDAFIDGIRLTAEHG